MHPRAAFLMSSIGMSPHPEGGYFREIYRSASVVQPADARTARAALTAIYFLLCAGDVSRWHRVSSDETWHFHEGDTLELLVTDPLFAELRNVRVGQREAGIEPVRVVPAGYWQAARSTGTFTLVSCVVGPGFVFDDFQMLRDLPDQRDLLRQVYSDAAAFL